MVPVAIRSSLGYLIRRPLVLMYLNITAQLKKIWKMVEIKNTLTETLWDIIEISFKYSELSKLIISSNAPEKTIRTEEMSKKKNTTALLFSFEFLFFYHICLPFLFESKVIKEIEPWQRSTFPASPGMAGRIVL